MEGVYIKDWMTDHVSGRWRAKADLRVGLSIPDLVFSNPTGAGFGMTDPAGVGFSNWLQFY